jgi:hypothetical protein
VSSAQHLLAMLDARSPGEREKGELTSTKPAAAVADSPRQRALGKTFPPKPTPTEQLAKAIVPSPPAPPDQIVPPVAPPTLAEVVAPAAPFAAPNLASVGPAIFGVGGIGGGGAPGGAPGGGGSAPGGDTAVVTPTPPVTSAVPEPGTWLMMLVGFGMIGSAMPRRRRRNLQAVAA